MSEIVSRASDDKLQVLGAEEPFETAEEIRGVRGVGTLAEIMGHEAAAAFFEGLEATRVENFRSVSIYLQPQRGKRRFPKFFR